MERVVVVNTGMYSAVKNSRGYSFEPKVKLVSPAERLAAFYAEHKYHMHVTVRDAFRQLENESKGWILK